MYFCNVFLWIESVDDSNVPVSKLCNWNVGRTLVLLLEWCEMYVENNVPWSHQVEFDDSCDTDSDWHLLSRLQMWQHLLYIISHACYNNEMLIKLLTFFLFNVYKCFIFVTFLRFNDFYFNMNGFFYLSYRFICTQSTLLASNEITTSCILRYALSRAHTSTKPQQSIPYNYC